MPAETPPTSNLPRESQRVDSIEVFERAFAADAAGALASDHSKRAAPARGLLNVLAGLGGTAFAALGGWLEPRCPSCGARGAVSLELRAAAEGEPVRLWERCSACDSSWASVRCEDFTGCS